MLSRRSNAFIASGHLQQPQGWRCVPGCGTALLRQPRLAALAHVQDASLLFPCDHEVVEDAPFHCGDGFYCARGSFICRRKILNPLVQLRLSSIIHYSVYEILGECYYDRRCVNNVLVMDVGCLCEKLSGCVQGNSMVVSLGGYPCRHEHGDKN
ncbi:uncharacterized protein [Triticum aestivum]|uniref:uncharacterized protein isoform X2 n=1 Tax=Triticum aestivum TaxID=4565 RepID=UPI001D02C9C3|nr:uncharacterized protein LOC123057870 isoform X2 [Triticum aestivum]